MIDKMIVSFMFFMLCLSLMSIPTILIELKNIGSDIKKIMENTRDD